MQDRKNISYTKATGEQMKENQKVALITGVYKTMRYFE